MCSLCHSFHLDFLIPPFSCVRPIGSECPALAVCFRNGQVQLFKHEEDDSNVPHPTLCASILSIRIVCGILSIFLVTLYLAIIKQIQCSLTVICKRDGKGEEYIGASRVACLPTSFLDHSHWLMETKPPPRRQERPEFRS